MLNKQSLAGILLAAGCPVLLWASTLAARVECRIDMENKTVVPLQHRPESYPFILLLAAAQGYAAWQLLKGDRAQASLALAGGEEPVAAIPPANAPEFTPQQTAVTEVPMPLQGGASLEPMPIAQPFTAAKATEFYDVAKDLGGDRANKKFPQNCLIVGTPGAGKGILLSNAIRALKVEFPELYILGIDPKAQDSEDGLWEVGDHSYTQVFRCPVMGLSPDEIAEWLASGIRTFLSIPQNQPSLLVIDELGALKSSLSQIEKDSKFKPVEGWLNSYLTHLISLGDGAGKWFWGITQSANDKALPFDTSVRNNLRTVAIVSMDNVGAVQGLLRTDVIASSARDIGDVQNCVDASPVSRAFYDRKTNKWHPMLRLKNHGEDRNPFAQHDLKPVSTPETFETPETFSETPETPSGSSLLESAKDEFQVSETPETTLKPFDSVVFAQEKREKLIRLKQMGLSKTQIIEAEWGAKPGGSKAYKDAESEYEAFFKDF